MMSSATQTTLASLTLRISAWTSTMSFAWSRRVESCPLQSFGRVGTREKGEKAARRRRVARTLEDDRGLLDRRVQSGRDFHVGAYGLERRRGGEGQRDDPDVRVARLR